MERTKVGQVLALWDGGDPSISELRSALLASGFEMMEAASGDEALARAAAQRPLAVLVDLDERDASSYLLCRLLRERYGELLPIVFLSGDKVEVTDRVVGLLLGADDYVVKPFDSSEVVVRIRRLVTRSAIPEVDTSPPDRDERLEHFNLTKREQEIMVLLLQGLTQTEIARELVISSNTVATHIQRSLLKLGVHNRAQAVTKMARAGWLRMDAPTDDPIADALPSRKSSSPLDQTQA